jgi:hypothetical protein
MGLEAADPTAFPTADGRGVGLSWRNGGGRPDTGFALACPACDHFEVVVPLPAPLLAQLAATRWTVLGPGLKRWLDPGAWSATPLALPPGDGPWVVACTEVCEEAGQGWAGLSDAERASAVQTGDWSAVREQHEDQWEDTVELATSLCAAPSALGLP